MWCWPVCNAPGGEIHPELHSFSVKYLCDSLLSVSGLFHWQIAPIRSLSPFSIAVPPLSENSFRSVPRKAEKMACQVISRGNRLGLQSLVAGKQLLGSHSSPKTKRLHLAPGDEIL